MRYNTKETIDNIEFFMTMRTIQDHINVIIKRGNSQQKELLKKLLNDSLDKLK